MKKIIQFPSSFLMQHDSLGWSHWFIGCMSGMMWCDTCSQIWWWWWRELKKNSRRVWGILLLIFFNHQKQPRKRVWGEFGDIVVNSNKRFFVLSVNKSRSGPRLLLMMLLLVSVILRIRVFERKHSGFGRSLLWLWTRVQEISGEEVVLLKASHRNKCLCWSKRERERERKCKRRTYEWVSMFFRTICWFRFGIYRESDVNIFVFVAWESRRVFLEKVLK